MDYHTNYNNSTSPVGGMAGAWAKVEQGIGPQSVTADAYYQYYDLKHGACTQNPGRYSGPAGALPSWIAWKNANSPYRINPSTNGYPDLIFTFNSSDTYCSGFRNITGDTRNPPLQALTQYEVYYNTENNLSSGWQQIGGTYTQAVGYQVWHTTDWTPVRCKLLKIRLKMSNWGWPGRNPVEYDCQLQKINLKIGV